MLGYFQGTLYAILGYSTGEFLLRWSHLFRKNLDTGTEDKFDICQNAKMILEWIGAKCVFGFAIITAPNSIGVNDKSLVVFFEQVIGLLRGIVVQKLSNRDSGLKSNVTATGASTIKSLKARVSLQAQI